MAGEGCEPCARPDSLQLEEVVWDFDRSLMGRQSFDSVRCLRGVSSRMCKHYSENFLNHSDHRNHHLNKACETLPLCDEVLSSRQIQGFQDCSNSDSITENTDSCQCERTKVSAVSYSGSSRTTHSAPVTPINDPSPSFPPLAVNVTTSQRRCTSLSVEPSPHYLGLPEPSRPYTSVILTLRPPSSDPQPIDISSEAGNLTYSSCSYDPRQGFESRLQISIGPLGQGTVSAARTLAHRPPPVVLAMQPDVAATSQQLTSNLPECIKALVSKQLEQKDRLSCELRKNKERLTAMKTEFCIMKADLETKLTATSSSFRIRKLREEVSMLQTECNRMSEEVVHIAETRNINTKLLPLGETSEEFYKNIYTGQLFSRHTIRQRLLASGLREGRSWTCHMCTFHNHPDLNKCEQCEMPRMITGSLTPSLPSAAPALSSA